MTHKRIYSLVYCTVVSLFFINTSTYSQQTASQLFEKALYIEEAQGELQSAIQMYQQILEEFPENRATGAKAQLHLGLCYEKLGLEEARRAYQRVITDFPEHREEVSLARDRLASLEFIVASMNRKPTFRKIEIASKPQNGVLSPDGNKLAFMSEGAVWVVPLHGKVDPDIAGEPLRLTDIPGLWEQGEMITWSADGDWIAVYGGNPDNAEGSIVSVIPVTGGTPRVVRLPEQGGHQWSYRISLSPDGQILAFSALEIDKPREEVSDSHHRFIYTIPTQEGQPKKISSNYARLPAYSPDGEFIAYVGYRLRNDWQENSTTHRFIGELWAAASNSGTSAKLVNVDGRLRGPIWSPDCRYIAAHLEPGKSNDSKEIVVYKLSQDVSRAEEVKRIVLPRSSWNMLAGWTPKNEIGIFMQAEEHSAIYSVPADGGKAVQISPSGGWPYYPRWSPDGEHIYFRGFNEAEDKVNMSYIPATGGDQIEEPVKHEKRLVSRIPGGGFNISPDGEKMVFSAYEEPYDPEEGVDIWTVTLDDGIPIRLTSDASFEGYPCWSPDGKNIAFIDWQEKSEDEGFDVIYTISAGGGGIQQISTESDSVGGGAIAYSPDGARIAFFSGDKIKTIPALGGPSKVLEAHIKSCRYRGHRQLAYSPDGSKIAYNAAGKIWITSLNDGQQEELRTGLDQDARLSEFSWSPDGSKIAFFCSTGGEAEFWLISDFLAKVK
jgi:Tol biopolymer transport system component